MLREEGNRLRLQEQFSILDSDDVLSVLKDAGGTTDINTARQWQWTISLWRRTKGLNAAQTAAAAKNDNERAAAAVMVHYQERLLPIRLSTSTT